MPDLFLKIRPCVPKKEFAFYVFSTFKSHTSMLDTLYYIMCIPTTFCQTTMSVVMGHKSIATPKTTQTHAALVSQLHIKVDVLNYNCAY